jgi:hypothetical protein
MPERGQETKNQASAQTANYTLACTRPGFHLPLGLHLPVSDGAEYLGFHLHAVSEMDRQLSDIPERVLIRCSVVYGEDFGCGIFHQVDRRKRMGTC